MLLHEFLEESARKYPDKVALVQKEERWTYRAIDERANQVAHLLRDLGIQRGDRVAIFLDNSVEAVISLFGILKADAVFLMLSSLLKLTKLSYILNNCQVTMPALHVDETSLRVDRQNHWIHVCSAGDITLKFLHPKRGQEAMQAIGVIPRYAGVIIHDCWGSYLAYEHCGHGLCGAHLLRELTFIVEAQGYAWAANMKRLLQQSCARVSRRKRKTLNRREYANLQKRYRNILPRGEKELPPIPAKQNGQRGRIAKSDAHNLWERLKEHETAPCSE